MAVPHLVTAEELERMGSDARYELVRGELVPVSQPGGAAATLRADAALDGEAVISGFKFPLTEPFAELD